MSSSRAIKPKRDATHLPTWEAPPERAPSIEREDPPTVARVLAMIGLFLVVLGGLAMFWRRDTEALITPVWGFFFASIGVELILFHSFAEKDMQFRRLYGFLAVAMALGGIIIKFVSMRAGYHAWFILGGIPMMFIGLVILVAVVRNESDAYFRNFLLNVAGAIGSVAIAFSVSNGLRDFNYLPGEGAVLLLMGLLYVCAYIGSQDATSERGYYAALALGGVGLVGIAIGIVYPIVRPESAFFVPTGLILIGMSCIFVIIALGTCVDWPIIVLARRDLAAYFYSPVAYLVFLGQLFFGFVMFYSFVGRLTDPRQGGMFEPIIGEYIFSLIPVVVQMFFVPALTMRLLSEESRSGTLEVLMTAPVNELSVVISKFLACWIFYLLLWIPYWLYLVALRYMGGEEFDYRPALSFMVAMLAISAGFMAMGLFISSLTSNQIVAAVLCFAGMMVHLVAYIFKFNFVRQGSPLFEFLTYVNFLDFWMTALDGNLAPRYLVLHLSLAVFFLFATVKVLEMRKWK